jgi:hypothetical protein
MMGALLVLCDLLLSVSAPEVLEAQVLGLMVSMSTSVLVLWVVVVLLLSLGTAPAGQGTQLLQFAAHAHEIRAIGVLETVKVLSETRIAVKPRVQT